MKQFMVCACTDYLCSQLIMGFLLFWFGFDLGGHTLWCPGLNSWQTQTRVSHVEGTCATVRGFSDGLEYKFQ